LTGSPGPPGPHLVTGLKRMKQNKIKLALKSAVAPVTDNNYGKS